MMIKSTYPGLNVETNSGSIGALSEIRFKDLTAESSSSIIDAVLDSINFPDPDRHLGFCNRGK